MNRGLLSALRLLLPALLLLSTLRVSALPAPSAPQAKPLAYLLKYVDQSPYSLWKTQPLHRRLVKLLGPVEYQSFVDNLDPATSLTPQDGVLYLTGNAPHRGGEEEAALIVDIENDTLEVFIFHKASIVRAWTENNRFIALPKDVRETMQHWPQAPLAQAVKGLRQ